MSEFKNPAHLLKWVAGITTGESLLWVILTVVMISVVIVAVYLLNRQARGMLPIPYSMDKSKPLGSEDYDASRYEVFHDALMNLALGTGVGPPELHAVFTEAPFGYCTKPGMPGSRILKRSNAAIVLTTSLLTADFKRDEVEAIIANLLAKTLLRPWLEQPSWLAITAKAREVGVPSALPPELLEEFGPNWLVGLALIEDAWGVRLTGRPDSMRSAIRKCRDVLEAFPTTKGPADPLVFADVPHRCIYPKPLAPKERRFAGENSLHRACMDLGRKRDTVIKFRLKSLEMIEHGVRQPHQEVRGGVPVTAPEGWE